MAITVNELELQELWSDDDPAQRVRVTFPVSLATGTQSTAIVYFELEPGDHTGMHTDSAEEIVLILEGQGEATVGEDRTAVETGTLAVIPALVPHDVVNTGESTLKVVGFFSSNSVVSIFEHAWQPMNLSVVGTPLPEPTAVAA
jgi:quercetin dioxygenase-like cupin family protein